MASRVEDSQRRRQASSSFRPASCSHPQGLAVVVEGGIAVRSPSRARSPELSDSAWPPWSYTRRIQLIMSSLGVLPRRAPCDGQELGVRVVASPRPAMAVAVPGAGASGKAGGRGRRSCGKGTEGRSAGKQSPTPQPLPRGGSPSDPQVSKVLGGGHHVLTRDQSPVLDITGPKPRPLQEPGCRVSPQTPSCSLYTLHHPPCPHHGVTVKIKCLQCLALCPQLIVECSASALIPDTTTTIYIG